MKMFTAAISLTAISLLTIALAQVSENLFSQAMARSATVQSATSDVNEASSKLERTKTDPLAVKPELLAAQQSLELAKSNLVASRLELRKNLVREYFAWTESQDAFDLAKLRQSLAQLNLTAANVRYKAGAINSVELSRAESDARSASIDLESSQTDLEGAAQNLRTRVGELPKNADAITNTPKPNRANLESNLENNPRLVAAINNVERSKLDLAIKDNEFTPQAEIDSAKIALENSERNLKDTRSNLRSNLSSLWDAYQTALSAIPARERNAVVSNDELKAQEARLAKGLASKLNVLQSKVAREQALFTLGQARKRAATSVLDLAQVANLDLWQK